MNRVLVSLLVFAAIGTAACVEKTRELTASEKEQLKQYVSSDPTTPEHPLQVSLEDKIELLGYDRSVDSWKPGEKLTVTWHWHVKKPLEEGWQLFTHVADANGADRVNQDGNGIVRRLYQPGRWKKGEYIKDTQEITLPDDWDSPQATLLLGLWNGPHRLQVTQGPNDGDNRIRAFQVTTPVAQKKEEAPAPRVPVLRAVKTTDPIKLDGKLDEDVWVKAAATPQFVNTMDGSPADPKVTAKVLWNDDNLYVAFDVADDHLTSTFKEQDDHLWEQDCVEIMVDPDGDGQNYFEMQVSPNGVSFDTRYDSRRVPQPFGHVDWQSELEAKVDARGKVNDDGKDEGYTAEIAIPWKAFAAGNTPADKPTQGATWRLNFYVMDTRPEGQGQRAVSWSPPRVGDFHVPDRFGRVLFWDPAGPVPQPTTTLRNAAALKQKLNLPGLEAQKAPAAPTATGNKPVHPVLRQRIERAKPAPTPPTTP